MLLQPITDNQAQSITGGGQLTTYYYDRTLTFELQTVELGSSNAGGQLKAGKTGGGWEPVYAQQWALVSQTDTLTKTDQQRVAGKGGVESVYSTLYVTADGQTLATDPRLSV